MIHPRALSLVVLALLAGGDLGCPTRAGSVPMAGARYPSTACVFGLRGVRIAIDDCDAYSGSLDVAMTMSSHTEELRRRAHGLLDNASPNASPDAGLPPQLADLAGVPRPKPLRTPARSIVEDVPEGVIVHVTPLRPADLGALRDEIEERIERASDSCP